MQQIFNIHLQIMSKRAHIRRRKESDDEEEDQQINEESNDPNSNDGTDAG